MSASTMKYLSDQLASMGVPFAWMRWNGEAATESTCYFVGEYTEVETPTRQEEGRQEISVILRGFTRGAWLLLEREKEKIEQGLPQTTLLDDGTGLAISYDYGKVVPTGDAALKSVKINLTVQEWKER